MKILFLHTDDLHFSDIVSCMGTLPAERQAAVMRCRHESDRVQRLCASLLVQRELCSRLRCDPHTLRIAHHRYGKPYVQNDPDLHFSISHTKGSVMATFSECGRIGADCELLSDAPDLVAHCFHWQEKIAYYHAPPEERAAYFTAIWTSKEAYGKCIGVGLADAVLAVNTCAGSFERHLHRFCFGGFMCTVWAQQTAALQRIEFEEVSRNFIDLIPRE